MKHIVKGMVPNDFEAWKQGDWTPEYTGLQKPEKAQLHVALISEQGGVCCYCGRSISQEDSHIEHFRPQESRPDLSLEYANLHASCIREIKPGNPLHCGHFKGNNFDEARHIAPQDPACESRFHFTLSGNVLPANGDAAAQYMIDLLNLNCNFLSNRRQEALKAVFDPQFIDSATSDELENLAEAFRQCNSSGHLSTFGHVVARYADQVRFP